MHGQSAGIPIAYTYNYWLVALSYAVAAFASYTAFSLLDRVIAAPTALARRLWLGTGAVCMGCGIWSMHFVGMLAVEMGHEMRYDLGLTALSVVFAAAASGFAFGFAASGSTRPSRLAIAGTILGAGIGAMHYTGMTAMRMHAVTYYNPFLFGLSVIVAVLLSTVALRLMRYGVESRETGPPGRRVATAAVMGLSITLMHFTGMAATSFYPEPLPRRLEGLELDGLLVAVGIGVGSFIVFGLTLLAALMDQRLKKRDMALQHSESVLQAVIDTASDAIVTMDEHGVVTAINPRGERIFGYSADEVIGQKMSLLIPSFGAREGDFDLSEFVSGRSESTETDRQTAQGRRKDGTMAMLEFAVSEMRVHDRRMYTAILRDVSRKHHAQQVLRDSEERLRASQQRQSAIMNSLVEAVISIDESGTIQTFNSAAERIFGFSVAEAVGRNVAILMPEPHSGRHDSYIKRFLDTGDTKAMGTLREVTARRKDGTTFPLELTINWTDLDGSVMFVGVGRDMTDRKKAEEERAALEQELRQAQKMESLGTLAGGIAHEINTPVQYVGDNVRFLQGALSDLGEVLKKYDALVSAAATDGALAEAAAEAKAAAEAADMDFLVEEIPTSIEQSLEGIERISEIVRAIKEFSHPHTKEKSEIDLNQAIATTITVTRNQWKYVAELETDFDASLTRVPCLPGEFNQVMLNLIVNAAHAVEDTGQQGRISITTRRVDDWAEIRVADTGAGISPENLAKIFDPFFTTKEPGKGTGQGLAISHSIVTKKHGGTIALESTPGQGTTAIIRLPLPRGDNAEAAA